MIQKIKSWIANKPQFEFIPGTMGYQVIRLSDGIVFRVNHPYI